MTPLGEAFRARAREAWSTGRLACGFIAGALFGWICLTLGIGPIIGWDFSADGLLLFAVLGAIASMFALFLRWLSIIDVALFFLFCVIAFTPVISPVTSHWLRADSLPRSGVDAVVVLSSSVTSGGTLEVNGSDRLLAGLELMRAGIAPRLLTTRVAAAPDKTSDPDQRRLIELASAVDRWILIEGPVHSTRDEVVATDARLRELVARRIAVVTSPLHTRRACAAFERDGMSVICRPARERGDQTLMPRRPRDRLAAFGTYMYERIAWLVYRSRGWVKG